MKALQKRIEQDNRWGALFGNPPITFPLDQSDVQRIRDGIEGDLSPENLHCDGEITPAQARAKWKVLMRELRELEDYCDQNGLQKPQAYA